MSRLFAMAAPILPGKEAEHLEFMNELKTRWRDEYRESRANLGVRERTFLQQTPMGSVVIVTLEGENPEEAMAQFGQGDSQFTRYFVEQVKNCHGFDLSAKPEGPMPTLLVDTERMEEMAAM